MQTLERTTGNAYAADSDYDALHGRVVAKYVRKLGITDDGYVIGRVTRIIDIGRAERITPRDIDEALAEEPLPSGASSMPPSFYDSIAANAERRHGLIRERIVAYLETHGPTPGLQLIAVSGYKQRKDLYSHLKMFPDTYLRFREKPLVVGLEGQSYTHPERQPTQSAMRIREILIANGPMLVGEIGKVLNTTTRFADQVIHQYVDSVFVKTGTRKVVGIMRPLWGLVGVHDQQDVAA